MPTWHRVTCVTRAADPEGGGGRITHLCGTSAVGKLWRIAVPRAVDGILAGKWGFFVVVGHERHDLIVTADPSGTRTLKARPDDAVPTTLLALPDCG